MIRGLFAFSKYVLAALTVWTLSNNLVAQCDSSPIAEASSANIVWEESQLEGDDAFRLSFLLKLNDSGSSSFLYLRPSQPPIEGKLNKNETDELFAQLEQNGALLFHDLEPSPAPVENGRACYMTVSNGRLQSRLSRVLREPTMTVDASQDRYEKFSAWFRHRTFELAKKAYSVQRRPGLRPDNGVPLDHDQP